MRAGWELKKLNQIGKVFNGNSINEKVKKDKYTDVEDGLPFIATKDVGFDSSIDYQNGVRIPFNETNQFKIAPSNTPLICAEGGSAGRKISFTNQDVCFGNKLFAFAPNKNVDSKYVFYYYFSSSFQKHFTTEMAGIIGGVSMNKFKDIEIPLPPLPEQHRIVAILDEAFAAIAKAKANAEQNLKNAKELFKSYLHGVFEKKGEGWEIKTLREVCKVLAGQSPEGKYYNKEGMGLPFYQGKKEYGVKFLREPTTWTTKVTKEAEEGDILMSVRAPVGPVNIATQKICIGRGLAAIRAGMNINQEFLYNFLLKHENEIEGNSGAVFNSINKSQISDIKIPLPTLTEQQTIVRQLDALRAETQKLEAVYQQKLADLEELKKSILQKAFAGELTDKSIAS